MDPLAKAAALLLSQRLSNLQQELDSRINTNPSCQPREELQGLRESIQQLRRRLEQIDQMR